jgi:L-histidine N-alpha-methyltransferase
LLSEEDGFLLGIDLIKDEAILRAAYDDDVSAAFNKNILTVLNRELGSDFDLDGFEHTTRLVAESGCMEQGLRASKAMQVRFAATDLTVELKAGESIHTEWSCKFSREQVAGELHGAGLTISEWWTDSQSLFSLALARRTSAATS